jgi:hypothetical protein
MCKYIIVRVHKNQEIAQQQGKLMSLDMLSDPPVCYDTMEEATAAIEAMQTMPLYQEYTLEVIKVTENCDGCE